jgi:hypothetical protein
MPRERILSFIAGEIASTLYSRFDLDRYKSSVRTCRNLITGKHGGAMNRPGTLFCGYTKQSNKSVRLVPFIFSETTAYLLELGPEYLRIWKDGAPLEVITANLSSWSSGTAYVVGNFVKKGTPAVAYYAIQAGTNHDPETSGAYWVAQTHYEVPTPFLEADLFDLHYIQNLDILTFVHQNYRPQELRRYAELDWRLVAFSQDRLPLPPLASFFSESHGTPNAAHPAKKWQYKVTAVGKTPPVEESLPVQYPATGANINAPIYIDRPLTLTWRKVARLESEFPPVYLEDTEVDYYNVYRGQNGVFGYVGSTQNFTNASPLPDTVEFVDDNPVPAFLDSPPTGIVPFGSQAGQYPRAVTYHEQRLVFAGRPDEPLTVRMSKTGLPRNFDAAYPANDDDAVTFTIAASMMNEIRGIFSGRSLLVFTSGAEYQVSSGGDYPITPSAIDIKTQSYTGCSKLQPLGIHQGVIYIAEKANAVRELLYDAQADTYGGRELSLPATHLFDGQTIVDRGYQREPFHVVWFVRSDGVLLGMTYIREHDIVGWHRHETGLYVPDSLTERTGLFKSVAVIPEGAEDVPYFVVYRNLNHTWVRCIEKLASRKWTAIEDACFVDAALDLTASFTSRFTNKQLHADAGWDAGETGYFEVDTTTFGEAEVGDELSCHLWNPTTEAFEDARVRVYEKIDNTNPVPDRFRVAFLTPITTYLRTNPLGNEWLLHRKVWSGFDHLKNEDVTGLGDGNVIGPLTVGNDGTLTVPPSHRLIVGLAFSSTLETLNLDVQAETIRGRRKIVPRVKVEVADSRGLVASQPDYGTPNEWKQRDAYPILQDLSLYTGLLEVLIDASWNDGARVRLEQLDPLPIHICGIYPEFEVGE